MQRRTLVKGITGQAVLALAVSCEFIRPTWAQITLLNHKKAFDAKSVREATLALGSAGLPILSKEIILTANDVEESGEKVAIEIQSLIKNTTQIAFLVEKNPNILAAVFDIPNGTFAHIKLPLKLSQSSTVVALIKAQDKFYYTSKAISVTIGGCGN